MDRRRLQAAAAEYPYLRGLFGIPLGALFLVSALGNWEWGPFRHDWVFVAAVLAIAGVFALINRYYNDHYGRVTPSASNQLLVLVPGDAQRPPLEMSANDRRFLKSLRISAAEPTQKEVE